MKKLKTFIFALFVLSIPLLLSSSINAQTTDQQGLSISPVVFELNSDPGDVVTNQIKIYNPTANAFTVKMGVEDFAPVGEEGEVELSEADENSTYSLARWTDISPSEFELKSKEQRIVTFSVRIPSNAEPGGHYGSIVSTISGSSNSGGAIVTSKRGALILLKVSGNIKEELRLEQFETTEGFYEVGPIDFDIKFENTGNVHLKPAGFIIISDIFGNQVGQIDIPQNNVIPGAIRHSVAKFDKKNLFGRYSATLVSNYGTEGKQTLTDVSTFIVVPWKKVLLVSSVLIVVIFVLIKSKKRISKAGKALFAKD